MGPAKDRDFHMGQLHHPLQGAVHVVDDHPLQKVIDRVVVHHELAGERQQLVVGPEQSRSHGDRHHPLQ